MKKKMMQISGMVIIILMTSHSLIAYAGNMNLNLSSKGTEIGVFGDKSDPAIVNGMDSYLASINKNVDFLVLGELAEFTGLLVIFAHGTETKITLAKGITYTWEDFAALLSLSHAKKIILASCYGSKIQEHGYSGPELISWNGVQDSGLIGTVAALETLVDEGRDIKFALIQLFSRALDLVRGIETMMPLAISMPGDPGDGTSDRDFSKSESGYPLAYKMQNTGSGVTAGRIIWLNLSLEKGEQILIEKIEMGYAKAAINALLGLGATSSTVGGFLRLAWILAPEVIVIMAAVLLVFAASIALSSINRYRHDFKLGIQGFAYIPNMNFISDMGNDNYRLDGQIPLPFGGAVGIPLYYGLGGVTTTWKQFGA